MRNIVFMGRKTYTNKGYIVIEKNYAIIFNERPFNGYHWYTDDDITFLGIKGKKNDNNVDKISNMATDWRSIWEK